MPAKRAAAAKSPPAHVYLTKADACRILQVAPNADEELITKAYWHQARKYRAFATRDPEARQKLDELNRAYAMLNPGRGEAPLAQDFPLLPPDAPGLDEQLSAWWRRIVEHTKKVWPGHLAEVAALTATTAVLTYLALAAGASAPLTLLVASIAAVALWSPWRRA